MTTSLLTHPAGLSLLALSCPLHQTNAHTPLSLPSRFPAGAHPLARTSPSSGHTFVFTPSSSVVWEYDSRGRRVGEMSPPAGSRSGKVGMVCPLGKGKEGRESVVISCGSELRVMEKDGVWKHVATLEGPSGSITSLSSNLGGNLIAAASDVGELVLYDQTKASRLVVPLGNSISGTITNLSFPPTLPSSLLLSSSTSLHIHLLTLPDTPSDRVDIREIRPFGPAAGNGVGVGAGVLDVVFSPVMESSDGRKKGGLCAVLRDGGEVALVGLDAPDSAAKVISFETDLRGLSFLDGASLAGCTQHGSLLIKDLRALAKDPVQIELDQPITSIHTLPAIARAARASIAPSVVSTARRTPLGESRNVANVEVETMAPPPLPSLKGKEKAAKAAVRLGPSSIRTAENKNDEAVTATATVPERVRKVVRTDASEPTREKEREKQTSPPLPQTKSRAVSAPQDPASRPRPSVGTSRAASNPHTHPHPHPPPSLSRPPSSARGATPAPIMEENEDADEDEYDEPAGAKWMEQPEGEDVHLSWALHVGSRAAPVSVPVPARPSRTGMEDKPDWATVDELRREIGNLQLDMLRMGRNLKNEIRRAVHPLANELKESREVIERQRREIERLRRGY